MAAGVAAATAIIVGPILVASAAFLWSLGSSWHHRPVSPLVSVIEATRARKVLVLQSEALADELRDRLPSR